MAGANFKTILDVSILTFFRWKLVWVKRNSLAAGDYNLDVSTGSSKTLQLGANFGE